MLNPNVIAKRVKMIFSPIRVILMMCVFLTSSSFCILKMLKVPAQIQAVFGFNQL